MSSKSSSVMDLISDAVIPSGGFLIYLVLISSTGFELLIRITSKFFYDFNTWSGIKEPNQLLAMPFRIVPVECKYDGHI